MIPCPDESYELGIEPSYYDDETNYGNYTALYYNDDDAIEADDISMMTFCL